MTFRGALEMFSGVRLRGGCHSRVMLRETQVSQSVKQAMLLNMVVSWFLSTE